MKNKGFVVSAVLYPLLVLFLSLIMGLLSMTDTRKRILEKMKLEISDSIFDEATCSCDTILNKLNYLIKNGVAGGGGSNGVYGMLSLNITSYEMPSEIPLTGNSRADIAIITNHEITSYYVSPIMPSFAQEGMVWIIQDHTSEYYVISDYNKIGISYVMQYIDGTWQLMLSYLYTGSEWQSLYYVPIKDGKVDITDENLNAQIETTFEYTGEYQTFTATLPGYYKIELWGAQGGNYNTTYVGGKGAYTSGEIYLKAGEKLYVYVGGQPSSTSGGWNGGGAGGTYGMGGGGSTDIRLVATSALTIWNEIDSIKSRIMVAGGGGGGSSYTNNTNCGVGGAAGGLVSYIGTSLCADTSSSSRYGTIASQKTAGNSGNFGKGGSVENGSGGGGGWYGGGSARNTSWGGPGAGGSSYISGHNGCMSVEEKLTVNNILISPTTYHYSGKYFLHTKMIDAKGYEWLSEKKSLVQMPTKDGRTTMIGNSGHGYAKITLATVVILEEEQIKRIPATSPILYYYTGNYQTFTARYDGTYQIELWGAQGGDYSTTYVGGLGGYTIGQIDLNVGDNLYLYIGEQPSSTSGGWNGGGSGGSYGMGGGGATDVRTVSTGARNVWNEKESLTSRIMVAAGGGGGSSYTNNTNCGVGGAAGGLVSYIGTSLCADTSSSSRYGTEASQISGGNGGSFGIGGTIGNGSGGGGGWYGGGSARNTSWGGPGAGGSSYISGHAGCIGVNADGTKKTDIYTSPVDSKSPTNLIFTNTTLIDAKGYAWTNEKSVLINMPSPFSEITLLKGNSGHGMARITYMGE